MTKGCSTSIAFGTVHWLEWVGIAAAAWGAAQPLAALDIRASKRATVVSTIEMRRLCALVARENCLLRKIQVQRDAAGAATRIFLGAA
jgi:hypothetical protein